MPSPSPELVLIVPVYNEEDAIVPVLTEWRAELSRTVGDGQFSILVIDDGSTDATPSRLAGLTWPELVVRRHANRGHGQSCLVGYIEAARMGAVRVFQIDSDGQCDPAGFASVWERRQNAPAIYGRRRSRDDGWARRLISSVLRASLKIARRTRLNDTNVPFRLYDANSRRGDGRAGPSRFQPGEHHAMASSPRAQRIRGGAHTTSGTASGAIRPFGCGDLYPRRCGCTGIFIG